MNKAKSRWRARHLANGNALWTDKIAEIDLKQKRNRIADRPWTER